MKAIFAALIVVFGFSAAMAVEGEASKMDQSKEDQATETNATKQATDASAETSKEGTTATEETK